MNFRNSMIVTAFGALLLSLLAQAEVAAKPAWSTCRILAKDGSYLGEIYLGPGESWQIIAGKQQKPVSAYHFDVPEYEILQLKPSADPGQKPLREYLYDADGNRVDLTLQGDQCLWVAEFLKRADQPLGKNKRTEEDRIKFQMLAALAQMAGQHLPSLARAEPAAAALPPPAQISATAPLPAEPSETSAALFGNP